MSLNWLLEIWLSFRYTILDHMTLCKTWPHCEMHDHISLSLCLTTCIYTILDHISLHYVWPHVSTLYLTTYHCTVSDHMSLYAILDHRPGHTRQYLCTCHSTMPDCHSAMPDHMVRMIQVLIDRCLFCVMASTNNWCNFVCRFVYTEARYSTAAQQAKWVLERLQHCVWHEVSWPTDMIACSCQTTTHQTLLSTQQMQLYAGFGWKLWLLSVYKSKMMVSCLQVGSALSLYLIEVFSWRMYKLVSPSMYDGSVVWRKWLYSFNYIPFMVAIKTSIQLKNYIPLMMGGSVVGAVEDWFVTLSVNILTCRWMTGIWNQYLSS